MDQAAARGNGWTALHLAAEIGSLKLSQAIVKKGANFFDAEARNVSGDTAADIARKSVYSSDKVCAKGYAHSVSCMLGLFTFLCSGRRQPL